MNGFAILIIVFNKKSVHKYISLNYQIDAVEGQYRATGITVNFSLLRSPELYSHPPSSVNGLRPEGS